MTLAEVVESLHNLENKMQVFEAQYHILTEDFYRLVQEGKLDQSRDFIRWMGYYELWLDRKRLYHELLAEKAPFSATEPIELERLAA